MPVQSSIDEICQLISAMLRTGYPTIAKTAGLLEVSPRTLQRQLSKAGVTYAELVTHCRSSKAQHLLIHSEERVQDIATILGYADPSSFTRAFIRWTGKTPVSYRRQQVRSRPTNQANGAEKTM